MLPQQAFCSQSEVAVCRLRHPQVGGGIEPPWRRKESSTPIPRLLLPAFRTMLPPSSGIWLTWCGDLPALGIDSSYWYGTLTRLLVSFGSREESMFQLRDARNQIEIFHSFRQFVDLIWYLGCAFFVARTDTQNLVMAKLERRFVWLSPWPCTVTNFADWLGCFLVQPE